MRECETGKCSKLHYLRMIPRSHDDRNIGHASVAALGLPAARRIERFFGVRALGAARGGAAFAVRALTRLFTVSTSVLCLLLCGPSPLNAIL